MSSGRFPTAIFVHVYREDSRDEGVMIASEELPDVEDGTPVATYVLDAVGDMRVARSLQPRKLKPRT